MKTFIESAKCNTFENSLSDRLENYNIEEVGSYIFRFQGFSSFFVSGHFINFEVNECHTNRLFCNKIWQATKFTKKWFELVSEKQTLAPVKPDQLLIMDKWILSRLNKLVVTANASFQSYDFHVAVSALKTFLYYDFCDVYLVSDISFCRIFIPFIQVHFEQYFI